MTISTRRRFTFRFVVAVVSVAAIALWPDQPPIHGAQGITLDSRIRDFKMPDQIAWKDGEGGSKVANLYGDPSKPGFYAQMVKRSPNSWSKAHFYDNDRFVTVMDGTLWVGTGKVDRERTVALKPGSFVRDIAGGVHFDGAKADGVTLYVVGVGPVVAHDAAPAAGSTAGEDALDPAIRQIRHVDSMPKESFYLYGDQSKPGLYIQYLVRVPHAWSRLHYHPADRFIMVHGGTMWIGTGSSFDKERTVGLPKGGFVRDIAEGVHYDGAKDDPLWIQISGIGPASSINVEPAK